MDYDSLLPEVGLFGRYQKLLIGVFLFPTVFPCAFQAYSQLFLAATPVHWCKIPELDRWLPEYTAAVQRLSIPAVISSAGGETTFEKCRFYNRDYAEIAARFAEFILPNRSITNPTYITDCTNGWRYDDSLYPSTVVTEVSVNKINSLGIR